MSLQNLIQCIESPPLTQKKKTASHCCPCKRLKQNIRVLCEEPTLYVLEKGKNNNKSVYFCPHFFQKLLSPKLSYTLTTTLITTTKKNYVNNATLPTTTNTKLLLVIRKQKKTDALYRVEMAHTHMRTRKLTYSLVFKRNYLEKKLYFEAKICFNMILRKGKRFENNQRNGLSNITKGFDKYTQAKTYNFTHTITKRFKKYHDQVY